MNYLLDTDHVSLLEHRQGADYAAFAVHLNLHAADEVGVSVVSFQEQSLGANSRISTARTPAELLRGYELMFGVIDHFRQFPLVPFDAAALAAFDSMRPYKLRVGTMDLRIAAVALSRGLVLVTRNARDFGRVPNLRTEDWTR